MRPHVPTPPERRDRPSLCAGLRLALDDRANLDRAVLGGRDLRRQGQCHVQIGQVDLEDASDLLISGGAGRAILQGLSDLTGGAAFFPPSIDILPEICAQIGLDLKNQYVLGYRSQNLSKDGRWRKVQVKVGRPKGVSSVSVRAKKGYYASNAARAMK